MQDIEYLRPKPPFLIRGTVPVDRMLPQTRKDLHSPLGGIRLVRLIQFVIRFGVR